MGKGDGVAAAAATFCAAVAEAPPPLVRLRLCWYAWSSEMRPPRCAHLHRSVACQWFLMAFSGRPGSNLASAAHRVPSMRCPSTRMRSSSAVHSPRLMSGLRWLSHRSRHCFPRRPSILPAMKLHFRCPCSSTSLRSKLSSCNVHCCVEPLNARCEPPVLAGVSGLSLSSPPSVAPEAAFPDVEAFAAFAALAPGLGPRGDPAAFVDAAAFFAGAAPFLSGTIPFRSSFDAACARKNGEEGDKGSAGATGGAVKNIPRVARETNVLGRYC